MRGLPNTFTHKRIGEGSSSTPPCCRWGVCALSSDHLTTAVVADHSMTAVVADHSMTAVVAGYSPHTVPVCRHSSLAPVARCLRYVCGVCVVHSFQIVKEHALALRPIYPRCPRYQHSRTDYPHIAVGAPHREKSFGSVALPSDYRNRSRGGGRPPEGCAGAGRVHLSRTQNPPNSPGNKMLTTKKQRKHLASAPRPT